MDKQTSRINFHTSPEKYRHWKLTFDGSIATLGMNVAEDGGLRPGYSLKLNSYDLGVDIELADAVQRIRFEHPEVRTVVITSLKERMFCAGANIYMLGSSSHGFKVNFCKFTNETRISIEDASKNSGIKFLCAINGPCAGGGYELALASDEIILVDDGSSSVSLPEVPLLGVLPGTGGLTRVMDKRKVRRDHADFFCTVAEGIRGKRAVEWRLVDAVYPKSKFDEAVKTRASELATIASKEFPKNSTQGVAWTPLKSETTADQLNYSTVKVKIDRAKRVGQLTIQGPSANEPQTVDDIVKAGTDFWPLRAFRELDDALLQLRLNEPEIGTILLRTEGDIDRVLAVDKTLETHKSHWFVHEIRHYIKRTLKRLDLTARSFIAMIEPGSCFAGTLYELVLAADRSYMLDAERNFLALSSLNNGAYPMGNGLSRLETHFFYDPEKLKLPLAEKFDPQDALEKGLVTFAPDEIDWEDEIRLGIEERTSLSPDAMTGLEANLRFVGPETMETKIFARLSAWQNWIFQRPNAVGEKGALKLYGKTGERPEFNWERT